MCQLWSTNKDSIYHAITDKLTEKHNDTRNTKYNRKTLNNVFKTTHYCCIVKSIQIADTIDFNMSAEGISDLTRSQQEPLWTNIKWCATQFVLLCIR